jgi:hypothetical protein
LLNIVTLSFSAFFATNYVRWDWSDWRSCFSVVLEVASGVSTVAWLPRVSDDGHSTLSPELGPRALAAESNEPCFPSLSIPSPDDYELERNATTKFDTHRAVGRKSIKDEELQISITMMNYTYYSKIDTRDFESHLTQIKLTTIHVK